MCTPNSSWKQWTAPSLVSSCDLATCLFGGTSSAGASTLFPACSEWDELHHEFLTLWGPDKWRNLFQQGKCSLRLLNAFLLCILNIIYDSISVFIRSLLPPVFCYRNSAKSQTMHLQCMLSCIHQHSSYKVHPVSMNLSYKHQSTFCRIISGLQC